jgi:hypothetical protein
MKVIDRQLRLGQLGHAEAQTSLSVASEGGAASGTLVDWLGFWSALAAAALSLAFAVSIVLSLLIFPQIPWTGDIRAFATTYNPVQMVLSVVPSILLAPAFLGVAVAVHYLTPAAKRPFTLLSVAMATLYVATVGINYFLQLTAVRANLTAGTTEAMSLFAMGNPRSIFWALEILGYFWQGAAALLMATYFGGGGLRRWTRWMLVAVFLTGVLGVVAALGGMLSFTNPVFIAGGGAWQIVFPAAMILSALYFRRQLQIASRIESHNGARAT